MTKERFRSRTRQTEDEYEFFCLLIVRMRSCPWHATQAGTHRLRNFAIDWNSAHLRSQRWEAQMSNTATTWLPEAYSTGALRWLPIRMLTLPNGTSRERDLQMWVLDFQLIKNHQGVFVNCVIQTKHYCSRNAIFFLENTGKKTG